MVSKFRWHQYLIKWSTFSDLYFMCRAIILLAHDPCKLFYSFINSYTCNDDTVSSTILDIIIIKYYSMLYVNMYKYKML